MNAITTRATDVLAAVETSRVTYERFINPSTNPHSSYYSYRWLIDGKPVPSSQRITLEALYHDKHAITFDLPRMGPGVVPVRLWQV